MEAEVPNEIIQELPQSLQVRNELLGLLPQGMPDGLELVPHDLIERLEQPILHCEILHVDLVGLPHLLETRVHDLQNGLLDPHHGPRHRNPNVDNHRRVPLELVGHVDVEPGPDMELLDVEALHGALGLGEGGDHGVGAVREG